MIYAATSNSSVLVSILPFLITIINLLLIVGGILFVIFIIKRINRISKIEQTTQEILEIMKRDKQG